MNDALSILPAKVRAGIYLLLIVANAVLVPLMAAGKVESLYGTIVLALLGVFSGATALANVQKPAVAAVVAYDAKHDGE